jgi:hypothetical protein
MRVGRRWLLKAGALALTTLGGGPGAVPLRAAEPPLQVVATTGMIGDIVRNVAGGRAEVSQLMGSGVDPHMLGYVLAAFGPFWIGGEHSLGASGMIAVMTGALLGLAVLLAPRYGILPRYCAAG